MKFIDLFSGTGAFSYVLERRNFECVFANDYVKESEDMYNLNNNPEVFKLKDIKDVNVEDIPNHDILCGGFPCQPFSIAGKKEGFDDKRANVFWKIIEILKYHKPEIIILENVKNLISHNKKKTFKIIKDSLKEQGYNLKYDILNTSKITKNTS
jgi:DNA (cytosine-5)-methyltransferase 1